MAKNRLYCGDNLEILATMEKESKVRIIHMPALRRGNKGNGLLKKCIPCEK